MHGRNEMCSSDVSASEAMVARRKLGWGDKGLWGESCEASLSPKPGNDERNHEASGGHQS